VVPVPEFRVVLYGVPPLLADLIQRVVAARFERWQLELAVLAETGDTADCHERIRQLAPHVVILEANAAVALAAAAPLPGHVRVLTLSPDLTRIYGPVAGDSSVLTPDALADLLYRIATI
jgi:hypothetical protein